jgi:hypothetical protein
MYVRRTKLQLTKLPVLVVHSKIKCPEISLVRLANSSTDRSSTNGMIQPMHIYLGECVVFLFVACFPILLFRGMALSLHSSSSHYLETSRNGASYPGGTACDIQHHSS